MPLKHKNSDEANKHTPKGFDNASNFSRLLRDEIGTSRYTRETTLPPALNFVDGANVPPTTVLNDVYVLIDNGGGAVNANWGGASYNDWVRFNGTNWGSVTPTAGDICYDQTAGIYKVFSASWVQFIPDVVNIYTTDDSLTGNRDVDLAGFNLGFTGGNVGVGTATPDASSILDVDSTTQGSRAFPRVTTAQMNAISTPVTNLVVFNTDLNSLMRYNGSAWVSMASGYGIVSVNNSSGIPTYYTSLTDAYASASSGNVVKLHSNITESGAVTIAIKNGVTLDLNGYTYTHTGNADVISGSGLTTTEHTVKNGNIIKTAGTGYIYYETTATAKTNLLNVYFDNQVGECLKIAGEAVLFGSIFKHNSASTAVPFTTANKIIRGGLFINSGAGDTWSSAEIIGSEWRNTSTGTAIVLNGSDGTNIKGIGNGGRGISVASGRLLNSQGISTSNYGISASGSATIIEHCYGESGSSRGINSTGTIAKMIHSTGISKGANYGIVTTATITSHCYAETQSGAYAMYSNVHDITIQFCTLKVNSGTGSGSFNNGFRNRYYNNVVEVASASAVGLVSDAADGYFAGNLVKGTATAVRFTTGSNQWTATLDGQGNSAQV